MLILFKANYLYTIILTIHLKENSTVVEYLFIYLLNYLFSHYVAHLEILIITLYNNNNNKYLNHCGLVQCSFSIIYIPL